MAWSAATALAASSTAGALNNPGEKTVSAKRIEASARQENRPPFEALLEELDAAVSRLENPELGLEEALAFYEAAVNTLRECLQRLAEAEGKVEMLVRQSDKLLKALPFEPTEVPAHSRPAAGKADEDEEETEDEKDEGP